MAGVQRHSRPVSPKEPHVPWSMKPERRLESGDYAHCAMSTPREPSVTISIRMNLPCRCFHPWVRALALTTLLSASSVASSITITYSGTIYQSTIPSILVGEAFSGSMTYQDPEVLVSSTPTQTIWDMGLGDGITLSVDGDTISYSANSLSINQFGLLVSPTQDVFGATVGGSDGFASNLPGPAATQLTTDFNWPTGALTPGVLPDPFNPAGIRYGLISGSYTAVQLGLSDGTLIVGLIDDVQVVPEPAAAGLR